MSEYRWCLYKNGFENDPTYVWYHADVVDLKNLPKDFCYHRVDGPFAKGVDDTGPFGWWYLGQCFTLKDWIIVNDKLSEEEKALLILEFA